MTTRRGISPSPTRVEPLAKRRRFACASRSASSAGVRAARKPVRCATAPPADRPETTPPIPRPRQPTHRRQRIKYTGVRKQRAPYRQGQLQSPPDSRRAVSGRLSVRPEKGRRIAAVLFTDLVGSTNLLSRLGETAYDDVRRAHFTALRRAIDESRGEEVKGLGDGLLAVFESAADALDCAIAIQQSVDLDARSATPLSVRVGVALGDVTFEERDVYGTAVVEAARLVAVATGGQILATALVRAAAGGRSGATFADLGALELRGLPEPVATCEVRWARLPTPELPLPSLLRHQGRIFVGREEEMRHLTRCWEEASGGALRTVLIAGEPGVGKTRLAAEIASRAHSRGATVLGGRCDEDMGVPYQPFVEALR
ncbi:MAG: adenylate/guanylate cyclase domain-containing protein, partial [Chloroflexi bacterium]